MLKDFLNKRTKKYENSLNERLKLFDDPLAKSIDWTPLKGGGTNFRTHTLIKDIYRMQYKASKGGLLFASIFALFGAGIPGWILYENFNQGYDILFTENLIIIGFGALFLGVGLYLFKQFATPITFDKHIGYFWKGKKVPEMYGRNNPKASVRLSEIHALQIIRERVKGDNKSYYSYEINLVTKKGERFSVIDHGNQTSIYEDVKALSDFLDVPVWDLSSANLPL